MRSQKAPNFADTGEIPQEALDLIRPYWEGELEADEVAMVEDYASSDPLFKEQLESRKMLFQKMDQVYQQRRIPQDFQEGAEEKLRNTSEQEAAGYEDEEELVEAPATGFLDSLQDTFGAAPWWIISGAFHALVILLVTLIGLAILRTNDNETVIVTDLAEEKQPEEFEEKLERTVFKNPVPIQNEEIVETETPIVTHEEVEIADHVETADDSDAADARGDDGISDVMLGGSGTVAALGLGGGGGGAFGRPTGAGGRLRRAIRGGGGKRTESAVEAALRWLARHQEADGSWSVRKTEGAGDWDPGVTGLAVLAFLGAGHSERVGKYKPNVTKAIDWIVSQQRADGAIGTDKKFTEHHGGYGYHHAICGMALAEAGAMARVPRTREAAQKAINYSCDKYQHGEGSNKLGWRYKPKAAQGDLSVSGWYVMQLKSAKVAGLAVDPASFDGAIRFLDSRMANPVNVKKVNDTYDTGGHRYGYTNKKPMVNTTSIGILCRLFTGSKPEEVQGAALWLLQTNPPAWKADLGVANGGGWPMYYMYYTTLTMFQTGGDIWKQWNDGLKATLCNNQRKGGDEDGSWDPLSPWEKKAGRAYTTALGAMCLEVYYRYMPLYR